jgi:hypothetical protein
VVFRRPRARLARSGERGAEEQQRDAFSHRRGGGLGAAGRVSSAPRGGSGTNMREWDAGGARGVRCRARVLPVNRARVLLSLRWRTGALGQSSVLVHMRGCTEDGHGSRPLAASPSKHRRVPIAPPARFRPRRVFWFIRKRRQRNGTGTTPPMSGISLYTWHAKKIMVPFFAGVHLIG